jgi:hypothetical protein
MNVNVEEPLPLEEARPARLAAVAGSAAVGQRLHCCHLPLVTAQACKLQSKEVVRRREGFYC